MDGGPFRAQRPAERSTRVTERAEPKRQEHSSDEPKAHTTTHASKKSQVHQPVDKEKKSFGLLTAVIIAVLTIAVIGALMYFLKPSMGNGAVSAPAINSEKYQAVFFTNGQVYFGKLKSLNSGYLELSDVFYIQGPDTSSNPQQGESEDSNVQLIKLGEEIHGPEDAMIISKEQVLFYENLKDDSKVVSSIAEYKKK